MKGKTYLDFAFDLLEVGVRHKASKGKGEVMADDTVGKYFDQISDDPCRYIQPQLELRNYLARLRSKNKMLFIATN